MDRDSGVYFELNECNSLCTDFAFKAALINCQLSKVKFGDVAVIVQASVIVYHFLTPTIIHQR